MKPIRPKCERVWVAVFKDDGTRVTDTIYATRRIAVCCNKGPNIAIRRATLTLDPPKGRKK